MKVQLLTQALVGAVLGLASANASVVTSSTTTYSAKVLLDHATGLCTVIKPVAETQRHRAIQSPTDTFELKTTRKNRTPQELLLMPINTADAPADLEALAAAAETFDSQQYIEVLGGSIEAVEGGVQARCGSSVTSIADPHEVTVMDAAAIIAASAETKKLVDSGEPRNRIDVVFMGDGYTSAERSLFFDDMQRLTDDMFTGDTFAQYLPLFNIWAAYVPSAVSGIGTGGSPRDTAFQLYRDGTELRGVYAGNERAARSLCSKMGTGACDYPSIIGNDPYYGGLGGEFVISTSSVSSGTMVLRHEMGHNFGDVGEEYDGGYVYSGANSARSVSGVTWKHWLTDPTRMVEEQAAQLYQKHIWYDLSKGAYTISFTSTGAYKRWYMLLSFSGADTDDSLTLTLDGKKLAWKSNGLKDRTFYDWSDDSVGFTKGSHTLVIKAGGSFDGKIIKQLCNAVIYEYMDEDKYKKDDQDFIGIYPTFDINKRKTYRPDDERCLMRNMTSTSFCRVCQENMWHNFMARIDFIDDVQVSGSTATLKLIPLGQLRSENDTFRVANKAVADAEKYIVAWFDNKGKELTEFADQFEVDLPKGDYKVKVTFTTPNVRNDPRGYMSSTATFSITATKTPMSMPTSTPKMSLGV